VTRQRLLAADPPGGQQPERESEPEHDVARGANHADAKDPDPRGHVERPHARPAAVAERAHEHRADGGKAARTGEKDRRLRHESQHRRPQHEVRHGGPEVEAAAARFGNDDVLGVDVRGRDQEADGRVDGRQRQPAERESVGARAHRGKTGQDREQQQRRHQAPFNRERRSQVEQFRRDGTRRRFARTADGSAVLHGWCSAEYG
jgi:hypothetical protein